MQALHPDKNTGVIFSCFEEKYFTGDVLPEYHSFVRIISGEMKVIQADMSYVFVPGDTFLLPRNRLAMIIKYPKDEKAYESVTLNLDVDQLKEFYSQHPVRQTGPLQENIKVFEKHPLFESFFSSLMPYFELQEELPTEILSAKTNEAITILRVIDEGIDRILADFDDPGKVNLAEFMEKNYMFNMAMSKFAYLTGRSLTTFKRDFKKAFNMTPQKWLTRKRLELAHYQLKEKNRKPVDVYLETGFENLSHFSYAFKKQYGCSPSQLLRGDK